MRLNKIKFYNIINIDTLIGSCKDGVRNIGMSCDGKCRINVSTLITCERISCYVIYIGQIH